MVYATGDTAYIPTLIASPRLAVDTRVLERRTTGGRNIMNNMKIKAAVLLALAAVAGQLMLGCSDMTSSSSPSAGGQQDLQTSDRPSEVSNPLESLQGYQVQQNLQVSNLHSEVGGVRNLVRLWYGHKQYRQDVRLRPGGDQSIQRF